MQRRTRYTTIAVTLPAAYLRDLRNLQARLFPGLFFIILALANFGLNTDPAAVAFVKNEVVDVVFARNDGQLVSRALWTAVFIGVIVFTMAQRLYHAYRILFLNASPNASGE